MGVALHNILIHGSLSKRCGSLKAGRLWGWWGESHPQASLEAATRITVTANSLDIGSTDD